MSLTQLQQRFIEEYLIDLNATQAAKRAGYSEKTAYSQGQRLLKNVEIQQAVHEAQKNLSERTGITHAEVIEGLKGEALYYGEGASHSARVSAWAHLGKHLGMFTDKLDVTSGGDKLRQVMVIAGKEIEF
jgi:phage terminase small subunit